MTHIDVSCGRGISTADARENYAAKLGAGVMDDLASARRLAPAAKRG